MAAHGGVPNHLLPTIPLAGVQDILALADALKREERERGRGWRWRRNAKALNAQMLLLEEDERQLEMVYPQVRRPVGVVAGCGAACGLKQQWERGW